MSMPQATTERHDGGRDKALPLLPRITVHAFHETEDTASVLRGVKADRRMSRTHMDIQPGGMATAIRMYADAPTPELLIIESTQDRDGLLRDLAALAEVCLPETRVVLLSPLNDVQLYRMLLAEGIADYLVTPLAPQQVVASLAELFKSDGKAVGRVISFIGAKGGVGASIIAHNVAWLLSGRHGKDTVIADLDIAYGTAGLDFNVDPAMGIIDAITAPERIDSAFIDKLLTRCSERLLLLAAPAAVDKVVDVPRDSISMIIDTLRDTTPFSIIDMPSQWETWTEEVLINTDTPVIVATPELAALRNVKSIAEKLKSLRANEEPPLLVLNQTEVGKRPEIPAADFASTVGLEVAVTIPFDPETFGQAVTDGRMIAEVAPRSKAAEAVESLSHLILGDTAHKEGGKKKAVASSLFAPLLEKLTRGKDKA